VGLLDILILIEGAIKWRIMRVSGFKDVSWTKILSSAALRYVELKQFISDVSGDKNTPLADCDRTSQSQYAVGDDKE
jgi:hypothetical protein